MPNVSREMLERWQNVVEQAMACIRGETPEDCSFGEAEDDTYAMLREINAEIDATRKLKV
jgi:hypothetical protein